MSVGGSGGIFKLSGCLNKKKGGEPLTLTGQWLKKGGAYDV
jgi:hypothetical protein